MPASLGPLREALYARVPEDALLKLLTYLPQGEDVLKSHVSAKARHSLARKVWALVEDVLSEIGAALTIPTPASHQLRLGLIEEMARLEREIGGSATSVAAMPGSEDRMVSTAEAAEILGYSRPHVAMLVDHGKLTGATVSAGGHRRIPLSTVWVYRDSQQGRDANYKEAARKSGMYDIPEATYLQAMARKPAKTAVKKAAKKPARRK